MTAQSNRSEWPLVVFTVALQLSCGIVIAATLCDARGNPSEMAALRPLALSAFPIASLGMLISALHLGRPISAWRSLVNLGRSRLSLEVVLAALFTASAFMYGSFWLFQTTEARFALGITASTLGLAAVVSSAMIYLIAAQPLWNSGWVLASFVGTTLLLGGVVPTTLVLHRGAGTRLALVFLAVTLAGAVTVLCSAVWVLIRFERVRRVQVTSERLDEPAPSLSLSQGVYFALYVLLASIVPVTLALGIWTQAETGWGLLRTAPFTFLFSLSGLAGVIFGRKLMYDLALLRARS